MKKVILHIGTGKTGTSSIQGFFHTHRALLRERLGVDYPDFGLRQVVQFGELIPAHYDLSYWISQGDAHQLAALRAAVDASPCEQVLFSCENFYHHLQEGHIRALAQALAGCEIRVVCYVRRQDLFIESAWKQQVKVGEFKMPFADFLSHHQSPDILEKAHANYARMLGVWADVLGEQALHVRVFSKSAFFQGDLVSDFLQACGLTDQGVAVLGVPTAPVGNQGQPSELIELLRLANVMQLVGRGELERFAQFLMGALEFRNPPLLTHRDRVSVLKNYEAANQVLFARFFKTEVPAEFRASGIQRRDNIDQERRQRVLMAPEQIAMLVLRGLWQRSTQPPEPVISADERELRERFKDLFAVLENERVQQQAAERAARLAHLEQDLQAVRQLQSLVPLEQIDFNIHRTLDAAAPAGGRSLPQVGPFSEHGFPSPLRLRLRPVEELPVQSALMPEAVLTAARLDPSTQALFGGIYGANDRLLQGANFRGGAVYQSADAARLEAGRRERAQRVPGLSVYLGWWPSHFGHVLMEATARLWAAQETRHLSPTFLMHPLNPDVSLEKYHQPHVQALFEAVGVRKEQIVLVDRDLVCDDLLVPTTQCLLGMMIGTRQVAVFDAIRQHCQSQVAQLPQPGRRLYLSRSGMGNSVRKAENEEALERFFANNGFEVVHPEQLPFVEQVAMMASASVVAGCDGSALHMALFMQPGTTLICLSAREVLRTQLMIGGLRQVRTHFVYAKEGEPLTHWRSPWHADIRAVRTTVRTILKGL